MIDHAFVMHNADIVIYTLSKLLVLLINERKVAAKFRK